MPPDFWIDLVRLIQSGAIVATLALPAGFIAWILARKNREPLLPHWRAWSAPWSCFEVVFGFFVINTIVPETIFYWLNATNEVIATSRSNASEPFDGALASVVGIPAALGSRDNSEVGFIIRRLWASALALPVQLSLLFVARRALYPANPFDLHPSIASRVALAVLVWLCLTPVVLSLNALLNAVFILFDWPRESHQLAKLGGLPDLESFLFFFQACVAAPLVEEILFRGIILSWAIGGRKPKAIADVPAKLRPWLVAFAGVSFAVVSKRPEAIGFSLMLTLGLGLAIWAFPRKQRYVAAVFSTSAMFATFHSSVWPSPIPLFFLAMGLGWLAVRTRGILASAIVHGLFNAVSVVVVLSSAN